MICARFHDDITARKGFLKSLSTRLQIVDVIQQTERFFQLLFRFLHNKVQ